MSDHGSPADAAPSGAGPAPVVPQEGATPVSSEAASATAADRLAPDPLAADPLATGRAGKPFVSWCVKQGRAQSTRAWRFVCDVARYYWEMRQPLWEYVAGFAVNMAPESLRMREVRLAPYESYAMAEFGPEGWKVFIPGRCVVCGERTQNPTIDETRSIDNAARAFWIPLAAIVLGPTVGWFVFGRWVAMLAPPLGFAVGYLLREKALVRLCLVRCDLHRERTNIPQVLVWGTVLVLRFGHKLVRRVFLYGETMDVVVPQAEAPADVNATANPTEPEYIPPTIPLADSPDPAMSQIKYDLPPAFEPDDENPSPPVP